MTHVRSPQVDVERLDAICRRYDVAALFVFGSVARDLLYDLHPGARLGWEIDDLAEALAEVFGRPVDLVSRTALHPALRPTVLHDARPVYAA